MNASPDVPPRAVIFDMDGVLVDSTEAHYQAWVAVCRSHGMELSRELFYTTIGTSTPDSVRTFFGADADPAFLEEAGLAKEEAWRREVKKHIVIIDGAPELVRTMVSAGWRVALGSSAPAENVKCVLERFPAADLLTVRTYADLVKNTKPAPDVFLKAAELLGVQPARCVVIEDSVAGLIAARRGGMAGIGLTTTIDRETLAREGKLVVDSLRELTPEKMAGLIN